MGRCIAALAFSWLLFRLASSALEEGEVQHHNGMDFVEKGMASFIRGDIEESVSLFDEAVTKGYPKALLWQRGLSLFYSGKFVQAAKQFRDDVAVNDQDTEEAIWTMIADSQIKGIQIAKAEVPTVGRDSRACLRAVHRLFTGEVVDEETGDVIQTLEFVASGRNYAEIEPVEGHDTFYAAFYVSIWYDLTGQVSKSKEWLQLAVTSSYAIQYIEEDFMIAVANRHLSFGIPEPDAESLAAKQAANNKKAKAAEL